LETIIMSRKRSWTRRGFLGTGLLGSLLAPLNGGRAAPAAVTGPAARWTIYERLGVRPVINAVGTLTTLGGSLMPPEVKRAMDEASRHFVRIHDLQAAVGRRLAELTGAEAAFVTAGASAALCLATCAVTAGRDPKQIDRLPDLTGMKNEIIIQKAHRNPYDHAFRMVGVKLVEVQTEGDMQAAVSARTAACAFVQSHLTLGHQIELKRLIELAHAAGVPLILDAAAELPPIENLSAFVKLGADLVAFSGGKNLRGPQASGLLLGRRDFVEAAYANSSPHNRFARIAKVGKEEIVGLLAAVELYFQRDHQAERQAWHDMLQRVADHLHGVPTVATEFIPNQDYSHSPRLSVQWDEQRLNLTVDQMVDRLRAGTPSIEASNMAHFRPPWKGLGIFPYNLQDGEEMIIARRVRAILLDAARTNRSRLGAKPQAATPTLSDPRS
jgi:L-seryl-tRNA(Ser) seleniumtransferase